MERTETSTRRRWIVFLALLGVLAVGLGVWWWQRAKDVSVARPVPASITESIASSGRVRGVTETLAGGRPPVSSSSCSCVRGTACRPAATRHPEERRGRGTGGAGGSGFDDRPGHAGSGSARCVALGCGGRGRAGPAGPRPARPAAVVAGPGRTDGRSGGGPARPAPGGAGAGCPPAGAGRAAPGARAHCRAEHDEAVTRSRVVEQQVTAQRQAVVVAETVVHAFRGGVAAAEANVSVQEARLRTLEVGARPEDVTIARERIRKPSGRLPWLAARRRRPSWSHPLVAW